MSVEASFERSGQEGEGRTIQLPFDADPQLTGLAIYRLLSLVGSDYILFQTPEDKPTAPIWRNSRPSEIIKSIPGVALGPIRAVTLLEALDDVATVASPEVVAGNSTYAAFITAPSKGPRPDVLGDFIRNVISEAYAPAAVMYEYYQDPSLEVMSRPTTSQYSACE